MHEVQEQTLPAIGQFEFDLFKPGHRGRVHAAQFKVHCDAIGVHDNQILLLSVAGPETSIKALTAGLHSAESQQHNVSYSAHVGTVVESNLLRSADGYRIQRSKLGYGLWHVLCLAKQEGFLPVLNEDTLWQLLQRDRFTTPLLRTWMPWLYREMKKQEVLIELKQHGCQAGLLLADNDALDELVRDGLRHGRLRIEGQRSRPFARYDVTPEKSIRNVDDYLQTYGPMFGKQAERSLQPLHVPGRDRLPDLDVLRDPFEAQHHIIEATRKALQRQKALLLVGEMGTGKTIMGLSAVHAHAQGQSYHALVFCPGQLVHKWEREIRETIPNAQVIQIGSWKDLLHLNRRSKPSGAEWYIIARDRAKLGAKWRPAFIRRQHVVDGFLRCPHCGRRLVTDKREPLTVGKPAHNGQAGTGLWKRRMRCEWVLGEGGSQAGSESTGSQLVEGCGSPLWQMTNELRRYEPALYIKRRLRNFFNYLILDEVHEEKGWDTAQGHAAGALASCCGKVIALTGTLIGGYVRRLTA